MALSWQNGNFVARGRAPLTPSHRGKPMECLYNPGLRTRLPALQRQTRPVNAGDPNKVLSWQSGCFVARGVGTLDTFNTGEVHEVPSQRPESDDWFAGSPKTCSPCAHQRISIMVLSWQSGSLCQIYNASRRCLLVIFGQHDMQEKEQGTMTRMLATVPTHTHQDISKKTNNLSRVFLRAQVAITLPNGSKLQHTCMLHKHSHQHQVFSSSGR